MKNSTNDFVLITGASAGIGKALAFEFARNAKNLLLIALPETGLEVLAEEISETFHVSVNTFCCDLTDESSPGRIFEWCIRMKFHVQVLVNNAGFGNLELFSQSRISLLSNMLKLNNHSVVLMTHLFIPQLRTYKQSYILNVSSMAAFLPVPQKSVYAATKSFIFAFSDSLRHEMKSDNISVSCLCPGGTMTERVKASLTGPMEKKQKFFQSPEDVAREAIVGMYAKRFRIIPGWRNRVMFYISKILPEFAKMALINICFGCKNKSHRIIPADMSSLKTFALLRL
jgi:uncharacterized protein